MSDWRIIPASWTEHEAALHAVRSVVFIEEQHVPEDLEWDAEDADAWHALALTSDAHPIGCVRLLANGQIGRMAVLRGYRRRGVGAALLAAAIDRARGQGLTRVFLHAQTTAVEFYRKAGFDTYGPVYEEAGIPHQSMALDPLVP